MQEKVLNIKKNGMVALLLILLSNVATLVGAILCGSALADGFNLGYLIGVILCSLYWCCSFILLAGLKVLKPQEAMVLTLFGKYYGTLKGDGFFFVNPFVTAINPASHTRLNQSGDVKAAAVAPTSAEMP